MKKDKLPGKFARFCKGVLNASLEVIGELLIHGVFFAVGLGLVLLFGFGPMELDPEVILLLGIVAVGIVAFLVYLLIVLFKKRKD